MGKRITVVLVSVIVAAAMLLPAGVSAADDYYTLDTGETHKMTLNISNGGDVHAALDAACSYIRDHQDGSTYTVTIPAGSYKNTDLTHVYSNTYIKATGAVITNVSGKDGPMIRSGFYGDTANRGYNGYKNITIDGGTWDGNGKNITNGFSMFKFGHAANVTMKNMTVKNDKGAHFVEFGGVDGVNVIDCSFSNYINGSGGDGGQEAVQFDINKKSVFKNFPTYDDTPCRNITVTGCSFSKVHRGVGSHSATYGSYYDNVNISNNTFNNVTQYAIIGVNFKNAKIMNNKITNAGCGIDFKYMNPKTISKSKYIKGSFSSNSRSVISGNTIEIPSKKMGSNTFGIRLYGEKITKNRYGLPNKNYKLSNVTVADNTITGKTKGILMYDVHDSKITGNYINLKTAKKAKFKTDIICMQKGSCGNTVSSNKLYNCRGYGINVLQSSKKNTFKGNIISGVTEHGINIYNKGTANKVYSNTVKNCRKNGINVSCKSSATIKGNKVSKYKKYGVCLYNKSRGRITGNKISGGGSKKINVNAGSKRLK